MQIQRRCLRTGDGHAATQIQHLQSRPLRFNLTHHVIVSLRAGTCACQAVSAVFKHCSCSTHLRNPVHATWRDEARIATVHRAANTRHRYSCKYVSRRLSRTLARQLRKFSTCAMNSSKEFGVIPMQSARLSEISDSAC